MSEPKILRTQFSRVVPAVSPPPGYPATFDWRDYADVLPPVLKQGKCNCCWCMVCASTISSARKLNGVDDKLVRYSHQQILDCTPKKHPRWDKAHYFPYNYNNAYEWCMRPNGGLATDDDYPFLGTTDRNCRLNVPMTSPIIQSYGRIDDKNQEELFRRVRQQHVATYMKVYDNYTRSYKDGIYEGPADKSKDRFLGKHAVYIIGWDKDNWIIRNSWSDEWAEGGDTRVSRIVEIYDYDIPNHEDDWYPILRGYAYPIV